jgi:NAD(P)-dependent dehydrogenase (short-subunit alcohol dehydrogenase family)
MDRTPKKIAVITGGSRGIGAATARLAAANGYDVCIAYVSDAAAAEQVAEACRQSGVRAIAVKADVASAAAVEALFAECDRALGPVSLLVNNAATIGRASTVAELPDDVLRRTFEVNVYGAFNCARAAIKRMSRKAGGAGGAIVNVSSTAATLGSPGEYIHYAASKGAIDTFTIGLAKEVGPDGIRVNAVQPGTTDTGIHARAGVPERPAMVARTAPLGRAGRPEDIAEAILWLGSDKAAYATGAILRVGGGL